MDGFFIFRVQKIIWCFYIWRLALVRTLHNKALAYILNFISTNPYFLHFSQTKLFCMPVCTYPGFSMPFPRMCPLSRLPSSSFLLFLTSPVATNPLYCLPHKGFLDFPDQGYFFLP